MADFLLFRLYGPLASWGEIAVGERRASFDRPSKSAVLGLLAAALGLDRADDGAHAALHDGYGFAVRLDAPGRPLRDYHTVQVPPARRGRRFDTRREELAADRLYTMLSTRDYLTDALFTCALWARENAPHELAALAQALERPRYVLYLGRKSCPPGLPLAPRVAAAPGLTEAFGDYDRQVAQPPEFTRLVESDSARLYFEPDAPDAPDDAVHDVVRRDALVSSRRRQFADRVERWRDVALAGGGRP